MRQVNNGRHCLSCKKTVIDFTLMNDEAIQNYFIENKLQPVCGRFRNEQLDRIKIYLPSYILQKKIRPWKKYLVILLLCFGSSIFSVDVFMGNGNLHAQTQQPKKHHKAKKKNKWISASNYPKHDKRELINMLSTTTEGFITIIPEKIFKDPRMIAFPEIFNKSISTDVPLMNLTQKSSRDSSPQKKQDNNKMEFILPAPLAIRRRKSISRNNLHSKYDSER